MMPDFIIKIVDVSFYDSSNHKLDISTCTILKMVFNTELEVKDFLINCLSCCLPAFKVVARTNFCTTFTITKSYKIKVYEN